MLMTASTGGVMCLQRQGISVSFNTAQQSSDGGIFGPSFVTNCSQWVIMSGILSSHCAETPGMFPNTTMLATTNIAMAKHLAAMVIWMYNSLLSLLQNELWLGIGWRICATPAEDGVNYIEWSSEKTCIFLGKRIYYILVKLTYVCI